MQSKSIFTSGPHRSRQQKFRQEFKAFQFLSDVFFFFLRSLPKRKSEVLTQQKMALKIECLKCANMWSLW